MDLSQKVLSQAFKASLPVAFGYFPLGAAFGVLLVDLGYPWFAAALMGLFMYAGAAQFMAISLLRTGAPLYEFFIMTLFLNIRHVFYGLSFLDHYLPMSLRNLYMIGSLTDETYSILTTGADQTTRSQRYYSYVSILNHFYWTASCTVGGLIGSLGLVKLPELEFALPCLFIVLAVEQVRARKRFDLLLVAAVGCAVAVGFTGKGALLAAIGISMLFLLYEGRKEQWQVSR